MLTFNLDALCKARGIKRPYTYLAKLGLTYRVARRLADGDTNSVKTHHIEKVCLKLNCTPNDLMQWTPEGTVPEDHPMHALNRAHKMDVLQAINELPLDKLHELRQKINELKE